MKPLTPRQHAFALAYLASGNATRAALQAGYSPRSAAVQGFDLLKRPKIGAFIAAKLAQAELTAERVLEELRRGAFFDMGCIFNETGNLLPVATLPAEVRTALESVEVVRTNLVSGDNQREWLHKVKAASKMHALELLAKHFRLVDEHVEIAGRLEVEMKFKTLDEGRARNAARTDALALPPGTDPQTR